MVKEITEKLGKELPSFEDKYGAGSIEPALKILAGLITQQYLRDQSELTVNKKGGEQNETNDSLIVQ